MDLLRSRRWASIVSNLTKRIISLCEPRPPVVVGVVRPSVCFLLSCFHSFVVDCLSALFMGHVFC